MKRKSISIFVLLVALFMLGACRDRVVYQTVPVNQAQGGVQVRQDVNLDPAAVLNIAARSHSASEFESNLATSGVWNISTTGNGQLDIPKVVETAPNGVRTFTILAVDPSNGQETFIANVPFAQQGANQAVLAFNGNPSYYANPNYSMTMPIADILMWHYLFSPHPYYAPVWGVGYRPAYYSSMPRYRTVTEMQTVTRTVATRPAQAQAAPAVKVTTPYDNKMSTAAKAAQAPRADVMAGRSFNEKNSNQSIRVGPNTAGVSSAQQKSAAASAGSSGSSSKPSSGFGFGSNRSSSSSSSSSASRSSSSSTSSRSSSVPRRR